MICRQFEGKKYKFTIWAAKYLTQELNYGQSYRNQGCLISFLYDQFSLSSQQLSFFNY